MNEFDAQLEFYTNEHAADPKLICCECGGEAEGECTFDDGGEICNACVWLDEHNDYA